MFCIGILVTLTVSCNIGSPCESNEDCKNDNKCINNKCINPVTYADKQIKKIKHESVRNDELMQKQKLSHPLTKKTEHLYDLVSNTLSLSYNEEIEAIEADNFKRAEKIRKARGYAHGSMFKYLNFVRKIKLENESKKEKKRVLDHSAFKMLKLTIEIYGMKNDIDLYVIEMDQINKDIKDLELLMTIEELENFMPKWLLPEID